MTRSRCDTVATIVIDEHGAEGRATVRVSARELAETTRWAFVAAGCSAGEAMVAGRIVQLAEVEYGCGVAAANDELLASRLPSKPIERSGGPVDIVSDRHGRGLLTLAPLAAALAATRASSDGPVILADRPWHPVMAAVLVDVLHRSCPGVDALAAWPLVGDLGSASNQGAMAIAGSTRTGPVDPSEFGPAIALLDAANGPAHGIAFASVQTATGKTRPVKAPRTSADGVYVEESGWGRLCEAAKRFLVVDA